MQSWVLLVWQYVVDLSARLGMPITGSMAKWTAIQLAMLAGAFVLATLITHYMRPKIVAYAQENQEHKILSAMSYLVSRRLRWLWLALILWVLVIGMRYLTWPSRSYLLAVIAGLTVAWLLISSAAGLVRNPFLARVLAGGAWLLVALGAFGLLEQTANFLDSFALEINAFRLSPLLVIKGVVAVSLLVSGALLVGRLVEGQLKRIDDISPSFQVLAGKLIRAILLVTALLVGLSIVGIDLTALAFFSGAIGLGIGFGLQKIVSNLISGIILLVDKSIKPGDVITVGDTYGRINELAARYVSVIARDGREFLIPNEDLITSQVINWSYSTDLVRIDLDFGVSHRANPHEVRRLAIETASKHRRVQASPAPVCHITEFGERAISYKLRFWILDPGKGTVNVRGDIFLLLWDALAEAGIEIPYPHRDVAMRGPVRVELSPNPEDKGNPSQ